MKNSRRWIFTTLAVLLVVGSLFFFAGRLQEPDSTGAACTDQCGNGSCEEMVCMAIGCPCAETAESCAADCAAPR